jgi:CubicO group peptidase (beta-lactamase class C family)
MMARGTSDRADVPGRRSRPVAVAMVAAAVLGSVLVACVGDQAADDRPKTIVMDDFESGALAGWQAVGSGSGAWFAYSDGQVPPDPAQSDPNAPFLVPDPPQGAFAAVTDMNGAGTRILYRDVSLEGRSTLQLTVFYEGSARFSTPDTLAYDSPEPNQQFRIDLIDPSAPIDSVADGDVLVNVFRTSPGDPISLTPTAVDLDLSAWAGQTVRLRLAQTDNQGPLRAGVDNIRFEPMGVSADARIELLDTPEPTSAIDLVLHRLTEAEALAALKSFVREEAAADRFSGAVLVAKEGKVLFSDAYGLADREQKIPNTVKTRFRIGSMNKMFTAVAILQLVEAGEVELTAPLGTYLTDYPNQEVAEQVTIHHLLTHTGGTGDIFGPEFEAHREELRTLNDYVELYGERGPEFEPGSQWVYSNYGFILLGAVIEAVTGQSYYDYVKEHIYEPAGMTGTGSVPEDQAVPDRAVGYMDPTGGTNWRPNTDTLPYRGTSAGGGYSTVGDFARFADALLSRELLSPDSTELLITGKEEIAPGISYAYGFEDHRGAEGNGWVGHGGGAPGMNGDLRIYPTSGYVVVVLANLDPPVAQRIADYLDARLPIVG